MTVAFYPLPETAHSQPKGSRSFLLLTFKASWRGACFWVTLLFTRSRFPRQLKPAGRLLELWMGLGSVPVAFWCGVASFLAGSWSTRRATGEIPLSASFLWSLVRAALKAMGPSKLFPMEGMGAEAESFGCWPSWVSEPVSGWEKSPCREEGGLGDAGVRHVQRTKRACKDQKQATIKTASSSLFLFWQHWTALFFFFFKLYSSSVLKPQSLGLSV